MCVCVCLRVVVVLVQWSRKVWWEARGGGREGGKTDYPPLLYCVPIAHYRVDVPGVPRKRRIYYYYQYYLALSLCLPASEVWSVWGARGPPCRPPRNDPDPDVNKKVLPGPRTQSSRRPAQSKNKRNGDDKVGCVLRHSRHRKWIPRRPSTEVLSSVTWPPTPSLAGASAIAHRPSHQAQRTAVGRDQSAASDSLPRPRPLVRRSVRLPAIAMGW